MKARKFVACGLSSSTSPKLVHMQQTEKLRKPPQIIHYLVTFLTYLPKTPTPQWVHEILSLVRFIRYLLTPTIICARCERLAKINFRQLVQHRYHDVWEGWLVLGLREEPFCECLACEELQLQPPKELPYIV